MLRVLRIIVCGASYKVGQASACQSERSSDSPSSVPPRQNTFSPETSPQLVDSSSWRSHQTSSVAPAALRGREISAVSALTRFDSPGASPPLPPRLRASASKSHPRVAQYIPPRTPSVAKSSAALSRSRRLCFESRPSNPMRTSTPAPWASRATCATLKHDVSICSAALGGASLPGPNAGRTD